MKELGEKTGVLVGQDLSSAGWGNKADPRTGATVWVKGETLKAESETADLWQLKWNENQIVLATARHTPDRNAGPLEGSVAGSWIVEQFQGDGWCWLWRDGLRGCEEGHHCGKGLRRKAKQPWKQGDTTESCIGGGAITTASLSPHTSIGSWTTERVAHQRPDALNCRVGPQGPTYSVDSWILFPFFPPLL